MRQEAGSLPHRQLRNVLSAEYKRAKRDGDFDAAQNIISRLLDLPRGLEILDVLRSLPEETIISPVLEVEGNGDNKLAVVFAMELAKRTGKRYSGSIVVAHKIRHTNKPQWVRMVAHATLRSRSTVQGKRFFIVDDVRSSGGTLQDMRLYIERNGGEVVGVATLAIGQAGANFDMTSETLTDLTERHNEAELSEILKAAGVIQDTIHELTDRQAKLIARTTLDGIRTELAKAGGRRRSKEDGASRRPDSDLDPQLYSRPAPAEALDADGKYLASRDPELKDAYVHDETPTGQVSTWYHASEDKPKGGDFDDRTGWFGASKESSEDMYENDVDAVHLAIRNPLELYEFTATQAA